ncbi:MAG: hypothetical protein WCA64_05175 [Gallionella sp.]
MEKSKTILKSNICWVSVFAMIIASPLVYAQDPVIVSVLAVHFGGNIQYSYGVSNHTQARSIVSVSIGNRGAQPPDPVYSGNAQPELNIYPLGSYWGPPIPFGDNRGETPRVGGTYTSPPGWSAGITEYGETTTFSIDWHRNVQNEPGIPPGQTFNFGVTVPTQDVPRSAYTTSDPAYLTGHFTVSFAQSDATDEGPEFWTYTGPIVPVDTTPPSILVTLSPATLKPYHDKLMRITATIAVQDDYDPQPEIRLESITANEVLDKDDVKDAQLGTDDRSFKLRAEREDRDSDKKGQGSTDIHPGRIYTVTYSATDASGNKSTASATVSVRHNIKNKQQ